MKGIESYININEGLEIKLNANESFFSCDEKVNLEIKNALAKVELNRYPEDTSLKLKSCYSKIAEVKCENVMVGNGSDEMIGLVIALNISKGKKLLTLSPDFSMYDYYVSIHEGEMIKLKTEKDGSFNVEDFIALGKEEDVDMIIFSNPNNPTGYGTPIEDIKRVLEEFSTKVVLVDEAYFEFNGETMIPFINTYQNLLVTRTLSKAWGLAAARVGFLIGNEESIRTINRFKVPYNVNSLSQIVAEIVMNNEEKIQSNIEKIIKERERVYKELISIKDESPLYIEFVESKANFIFGRSCHKEGIVNELKSRGIMIRSFQDDSFRVTIGSTYENNKFLNGLKEILGIGGDEFGEKKCKVI